MWTSTNVQVFTIQHTPYEVGLASVEAVDTTAEPLITSAALTMPRTLERTFI
jgi:hypothetical protein